MKIIFNTRMPTNVASMFYRNAFMKILEVDFCRWDNYDDYDVALFMTYKEDLKDLVDAKIRNPRLLTGLIDARGSWTFNYMEYIDFLVFDSIEMKDFFAEQNKPMFLCLEYPQVPAINKVHRDKKKIVIGYHGNRVHLSSMFPNVSTALDALNEKYDLELWAVYNMKEDRCRVGLPRKTSVRHIQWHEKVYEEELMQVDIGIAPATIPLKKLRKLKRRAIVSKYFCDNDDDYLIRFKMPSNAGRIVAFGLLGIPVVADFLPSFMQVIRDGENGFLAYSSGGWYRALESLIVSADLRNSFAHNLQKTIIEKFEISKQNEEFIAFCGDLMRNHNPQCPLALKGSIKAEAEYKMALFKEYLRMKTKAGKKLLKKFI